MEIDHRTGGMTGMPGNWSDMAYITFELEADCIQGWSESFDKLEAYLDKRLH